MSAVIDMSQGRRDRKRRELHERVARSALDLFMKNGFEETTIDEIANTADISRRSFFHYFTTKEDVVCFWKDEFFETMLEAAQGFGDVHPMELMEYVLMAVARRHEGARIIAIDKLIRATPSLTARRLVDYDALERSLVRAMAMKWPEREQPALRLIAVVGVGLLKTAVETWSADGYRKAFAEYLTDGFLLLRRELAEPNILMSATTEADQLRGRRQI